MEQDQIQRYLLDAIPYPIVFVDTEHIVRYMNKSAEYFYYTMRGYAPIIGNCLFDCHNEKSKAMIMATVENLKNHGNEVFLGVDVQNRRVYINPVRDDKGVLIGYFERFEMNIQK